MICQGLFFLCILYSEYHAALCYFILSTMRLLKILLKHVLVCVVERFVDIGISFKNMSQLSRILNDFQPFENFTGVTYSKLYNASLQVKVQKEGF